MTSQALALILLSATSYQLSAQQLTVTGTPETIVSATPWGPCVPPGVQTRDVTYGATATVSRDGVPLEAITNVPYTAQPMPVSQPCTIPTEGPLLPVGSHGFIHGVPAACGPTTITSAKSGAFSDPSSWLPARVPNTTDNAVIRQGDALLYDVPNGDVGCLGVKGSLVWKLDANTRLKVTTLGVYQGGNLFYGAAAGFTAELIGRDVPIDLVRDPEQTLNGIFCANATCKGAGQYRQTRFLRLGAEAPAGTTTITLSTASDWKAGDDILLHDTRQLVGTDLAPRPNGNRDNVRRKVSQSETAMIAVVNGTTLTLTAPLQFDHKGARDPDGNLVYLPYVGSLWSNATIRSENPNGTRWHTLVYGVGDYFWDGLRLKDLGRTTTLPLDSTTYDADGNVVHIGTNQIGRYPMHFHHVPGTCSTPVKPYQFAFTNSVVWGSPKWGPTVHNSHFGNVSNNVVYDAAGALLVTEDGSETGNLFEHNLLVRSENGSPLVDPIEITGGADPFARKGNGTWFKGIQNVVRDNVIADTREGLNFSPATAESGPQGPNVNVNIPLYPCADTSMPGQYKVQSLLRTYNREVSGNEVWSTSQFSFGTWFMEMPTTGRVPFMRNTLIHFFGNGRYQRYWNGTEDRMTILNEGGLGLAVNEDNWNRTGMATSSTISNANIQGVDAIFNKGGQLGLSPEYIWENGVFRSRNGFLLNASGQMNVPSNWVFRNLRVQALPGFPLRAFTLSTAGTDINNTPKSMKVFSYQGVANDNRDLFWLTQVPTGPAPFGINSYSGGSCPVPNQTNQSCWNTYHTPSVVWFGTDPAKVCSTQSPDAAGAFFCPQ